MRNRRINFFIKPWKVYTILNETPDGAGALGCLESMKAMKRCSNENSIPYRCAARRFSYYISNIYIYTFAFYPFHAYIHLFLLSLFRSSFVGTPYHPFILQHPEPTLYFFFAVVSTHQQQRTSARLRINQQGEQTVENAKVFYRAKKEREGHTRRKR